MSIYEVLDLVADNYARIDVLWNFFIWIHLAVIGGLVLLPRRVSLLERLIVILAYCAFSYVNWSALRDAYAYQIALLAEATRMTPDASGAGRIVLEHLSRFMLHERISWFDFVHPTAAVIVSVALLSANRFSALRRAAAAT